MLAWLYSVSSGGSGYTHFFLLSIFAQRAWICFGTSAILMNTLQAIGWKVKKPPAATYPYTSYSVSFDPLQCNAKFLRLFIPPRPRTAGKMPVLFPHTAYTLLKRGFCAVFPCGFLNLG